MQSLARGLSQTDIAKRLGITFQQIQKYERGVNRVGAGRLQEMANLLGVTPAFFFEDGPRHKAGKSEEASETLNCWRTPASSHGSQHGRRCNRIENFTSLVKPIQTPQNWFALSNLMLLVLAICVLLFLCGVVAITQHSE